MTQGTMELIQTVTVPAGGQAAIEFTNIPQTYDDLYFVISARNNADNYGGFYMRFNGSSSSYSARRLRGDGSSAASDTSTEIGWSGSGFTASTFGNAAIYIPNYRSSNNKSASIDYVSENNATSTRMGMSAYLWSNNAAITSVSFGTFDSGFPNDIFAQHSTATLYGITRVSSELPKATGGTIYADGSYWYHAFTSSGTFTPSQSLTCDVLVIAGGGGGGGFFYGGGGGAGGVAYYSSQALAQSSANTVTIGAGGSGTSSISVDGLNGNNSTFAALSAALGGGGGGAVGRVGLAGGSGGGGGGEGGGTARGGGAGTSGQGFAGGSGFAQPSRGAGGGGGGSAAVGGNGSTDVGGVGGNGVTTYSSWGASTQTGQNVNGIYYYAGGGGGSTYELSTAANTGGLGGGGAGAAGAAGRPAVSGTSNTGGGGGGWSAGGAAGPSGNGGSGIVIVRYAK